MSQIYQIYQMNLSIHDTYYMSYINLLLSDINLLSIGVNRRRLHFVYFPVLVRSIMPAGHLQAGYRGCRKPNQQGIGLGGS